MGIYYKTYLCRGNGTTFEYNRKIEIAGAQIIEPHEWRQGYVKLSELVLALASPLNDIRIKIEPDTVEDLFLEEVMYSTYNTSSSKFILVECHYIFVEEPLKEFFKQIPITCDNTIPEDMEKEFLRLTKEPYISQTFELSEENTDSENM